MDKMNAPSVKCKIEILCAVNPSEDPKKVETTILNIFSPCEIDNEKLSIVGKSNNLNSLEKVQDSVHSMQSQRIYRRTLEKNMENNSSWFYLNKQAAFVNKVAICEESDESPLGPIKVILTSTNLDRIITWLTFEENFS